MAALQRCYRKLHLRINEAKSAVASVWSRKFLGYCFWAAPKGEVRRAVAKEALQRYRQRIRQITRRQTGRSMQQIAEELQTYVPGWKAYFRLAQTPRVWRELDEWMRHRLRAVQLKHWGRSSTAYPALLALGASADTARQVATNVHRWWHNSAIALNRVMPIAYFDRLGAPRLC